MKKYDSYKNSGTKWIGQIPAHWDLLSVKRSVKLNKGTKPKDLTNEANGFPYLTMDYLRGREDKMTLYPISTDGLDLLEDGEIIVLWDGANAGEFMLSKKGYLGSTMASISVDQKKYNKDYYFYLLKSIEKTSKDYANGTTIPHFDGSVLTDYKYPCPPMAEQVAIASYLNGKCEKVDMSVAAITSQIEDLMSYRQSIIDKIITKGLYTEANLKDSGIEWIGRIPEKWVCVKLKHLLSEPLMYGASESGDSDFSDNPRYIRITDISPNGTLRDSNKKYLDCAIAKPYMLKKGDILFARSGATVGKTYMFCENIEACFAGYLIKASVDKNKMIPRFLYLYTQSRGYENWKNCIFTQATIQNISADKYDELFVPIPPIAEQQEIVNFLDSRISGIDETIESLESQCEDLMSFKQSVISEAVTGKIKVID